jgi:hypothetical protein
MSNGNFLILGSEYKVIKDYYTSETDENAARKDTKVMADVILEFTPRGEVVWEWHAFDYLDPFRIGYGTLGNYWNTRGFQEMADWTHGNSVVYDENDDAVLINFRFLSSIVKINKKTKEIEWIFGEPSGYSDELKGKLISLTGGEWFWHEHSHCLTDYGTLLIFNNALSQARPFDPPVNNNQVYSYAVEFEIDEDSQTAEELWTSKVPGETGLVSSAMGDVDWLETKDNILVSYGLLRPNGSLGHNTIWTMIREYDHKTPPEIIWELQLSPLTDDGNVGWSTFSGERIKNFIEQ